MQADSDDEGHWVRIGHVAEGIFAVRWTRNVVLAADNENERRAAGSEGNRRPARIAIAGSTADGDGAVPVSKGERRRE